MLRPHTALPEVLGVPIDDLDLLRGALMHHSYRYDHPVTTAHAPDTQRLEFLGDAVVNIVATQMIFRAFPTADEGDMTRLRSALIRTENLADIARIYDLGSFVIVNKGEELAGARNRTALLADVFEAIVAVIFLNCGLATAQSFLEPHFQTNIDELKHTGVPIDVRSKLQELIQRVYGHTPRYQTLSMSGPEHQRIITVTVSAAGVVLGQGSGHSQAIARQHAAEYALAHLDDITIPPKTTREP